MTATEFFVENVAAQAWLAETPVGFESAEEALVAYVAHVTENAPMTVPVDNLPDYEPVCEFCNGTGTETVTVTGITHEVTCRCFDFEDDRVGPQEAPETDADIVLRIADALGRKFEVDDLRNTGAQGTFLFETAEAWLPSQKDASFEWLRDIARKYSPKNGLTDAAAKGVLNCMVASLRREQRGSDLQERVRREFRNADGISAVRASAAASQVERVKALEEARERAEEIRHAAEYQQFLEEAAGQAGKSSLGKGRYTVAFADGDHRTLKVGEWREDTRRPGSKIRWIGYLSGPDNGSDYETFARQHDNGQWIVMPKFRNNVSGSTGKLNTALMVLFGADEEARMAAREAYALESGKCSRCNRDLTVPASIHRGLGPECAKKGGI